MPGLSDEARRALRSFDAQHQAPDDAREANYAAVMRRIPAVAPEPRRAMPWWPIAGSVAAAALVLVAATMLRGQPTQPQAADDRASLAPSTAREAPEHESVQSPPEPKRAVPEPTPAPRVVPEAEVEPPVPAPRRPKASARSTAHPEPPDPTPDLARESALILQARTALGQGRLQAAKRSLLEHRAEFPQGVLLEERRAFEAELACRQGDPAAAERLGAFRRRHPESTLQARVEAACDSVTETAARSQEG